MSAAFVISHPLPRAGLVLLWAAAVWASAWADMPALLRACLVIPVLSYCPGWLLLRALRLRVRGLEAQLLSIALSWAVLIACGFALHPFDALSESGWLIATGGVMVVLALVAPADGVRRPPAALSRPGLDVVAAAGFTVAGGLALGAIGLAAWQAEKDRPFEILELWMLPGDGSGEVQVGFHNGDPQERIVRLEVRGEGKFALAEAPMVLAPGQTVIRKFPFPPAQTGKPARIEAVLFDQNNRMLRRTHLGAGAARQAGTIKAEPDE